MASGRPIVAHDLTSFREIIDETMAIIVEPDDPRALARGIERACNGDNDSIVANAKKEVEKYSWHKRAEAIFRFISDR